MGVRYCSTALNTPSQVLGLKKHFCHSSIYLIHIPLHSIYTNSVSTTSFRTYKHGSVCSCSVAVVGTVLCTKAVWDTQLMSFPATYETTTSFARFRRCCTNSIPCYAPYGPGQHIMYRWSMLLLPFKSMGLLIRQAPT